MEILRGENLGFKYASLENQSEYAIKDINFSVNSGEFVVIMGESGCGKTTLLKMMKKEMTPSGERIGKIVFDGQDVAEMSDRDSVSRIGYVMQKPEEQIVTDKVYHELAFVLESLSYKTDEIRIKVGEIANYFGIEKLFRSNTTDLSGGEKQIINLASVMVTSPDVLILDEPTSQLDPIAASEFISTLAKINKELGLTIILVEHRLEDVFSIADKVILMEKGRIICEDTPKNVGKFLSTHKMIAGAPKSVVLYKETKLSEDCPVSVKEGRDYIVKCGIENKKDVDSFRDMSQEIKDKNIEVNETIHSTEEMKKIQKEDKDIISAKGIWFRYEKDGEDVLRDLSISIKEGEIYSLLGGNGSGKSTLLSILSGVNRAYKGKISIDGKKIRDYKGNSLYRNMLNLLPQDPSTVFVKSKVIDDYIDILKAHEISDKKVIDEKIQEVADLLSISHLLERHPYDLSGGEQQRCALGKLLILSPKILLLDEPTKGIDGLGKENMIRILKDLKQKGITILIVTHDVEFAAEASDRCGMLFDGEIISSAVPNEFFRRNNFYTTAVNRMCRGIYDDVIYLDELVEIIKNGKKL